MLRSLFVLLLLSCTSGLYSQDTIVKVSGEYIIAKVKTVSEDAITYTRYDSQDGPEYTLATKQIRKIMYADGRVEMYTYHSPAAPKKTYDVTDVPSNFFGITLTDFIPGQVSVSLEHVLVKNELSIRIPLSLGVYQLAERKPSAMNDYYYYDPYKKFSLGLDIHYFAQKANRSNYFVGASIEGGKGTYGLRDPSTSVVSIKDYKYFGLGIVNGFRFLVSTHVNIQVYACIGMQLMSNNDDRRAMGRSGLILGYVW